MKVFKWIKLTLFISVISIGVHHNVAAQSIEKIRITEHYRDTPLNEVLNDFKEKYGIKIEYDSTTTAKYSFSDRVRFRPSISFKGAIEAICSDFPDLTYSIDEYDVLHLERSSEALKRIEAANSKYVGSSKKENIRIAGIIKDIESGESLPFATIGVRGTTNGTTTNVDGYFSLFDVPTDTTSLQVAYLGYESTKYFLSPEMALSKLVIYLKPSSTTLESVVISAEKEHLMQKSDQISVIKMSPKQMAKLPNIGEKDIFRSFQLLPGVSGSNESSAGLFVRGGTPDQNLILYDGFTVYQVDHLFGMFSAFNSNAIKDVQLYKGGFGAQFGGRISSVMEIVGKDGNENKFNIGGDIGFLSANLYVEAPIKDKITILFAARRSWKNSFYNNIFDKFNEADQTEAAPAAPTPPAGRRGSRVTETVTPTSYFYDLNAKISYKPTSKDIISYSFFSGEDDLDNSRSLNRSGNSTSVAGGINDITKWGNWGMSTTWSRKWGTSFYSNILASMSNYFSTRDLRNTRTVTDAFGDESVISRGSLEDNNLKDYTVKIDNELNIGKVNTIGFGVQASNYNIDYNYNLNDTITIQERHDNGTVLSVYAEDKIKLFNKLTLTPGIRASYYDITDKTYFEPRASVNYKLTDNISLKGAWGHYYQFANRIIRNDISSGSRDFWVLADDVSVPISFAEHFIGGVSFETGGYLFDVEAYYKNLSGLSEYSLQFAPSFNNVDFNEFFYEGTGTAKGIEFLVQKKYGNYSGWAGYTLGQVLYNFPIYGENSFAANHDVTHEFKLVNLYRLNNWTFSANWIYATGKPYTEPLGGYSVELLDDKSQDFLHIGQKNSSRYPDYHRLDVSATLDFDWGKTSKGSIAFSVFNVYNRENIWYKQFEVEEDELIETDVTLLGFTPSITLSLKLR